MVTKRGLAVDPESGKIFFVVWPQGTPRSDPAGANPRRGDHRDAQASKLPRQNRKSFQALKAHGGTRFRRLFCSTLVRGG